MKSRNCLLWGFTRLWKYSSRRQVRPEWVDVSAFRGKLNTVSWIFHILFKGSQWNQVPMVQVAVLLKQRLPLFIIPLPPKTRHFPWNSCFRFCFQGVQTELQCDDTWWGQMRQREYRAVNADQEGRQNIWWNEDLWVKMSAEERAMCWSGESYLGCRKQET